MLELLGNWCNTVKLCCLYTSLMWKFQISTFNWSAYSNYIFRLLHASNVIFQILHLWKHISQCMIAIFHSHFGTWRDSIQDAQDKRSLHGSTSPISIFILLKKNKVHLILRSEKHHCAIWNIGARMPKQDFFLVMP